MRKQTRWLPVIVLAIAFAGFAPKSAQAGPDRSIQVFHPVKTQEEVQAIKPGTKVAVTCPDCKAVIVKKVNKDKSNLTHFDCPVCKHSFELVPSPTAKTQIPKLLCRDSKGHVMPLNLCAEMH
jgi:rubredoxin